MPENEIPAATEYLEKYAVIFNNMVKEALTRGTSEMPSDLSEAFNPKKLTDLLTMESNLDASKLVESQLNLFNKQLELWQNTARSLMGEQVDPVITEERGDGRFRDASWADSPAFSFIKQSYLLNSQMLQQLVNDIEFKDEKIAKQADFYTRQFINSMSPSNYILTNPEVFREVVETKGECLQKGIDNFVKDLENSPAEAFRITQTDPDAFELGEDLANTPGKVVYQNELMQLIQYQATTKQVYKRPILMTPPFINKYYILDLGEKKSVVRWLVSQGYTVFIISWVNPDASLSHKNFESYMKEGPLAALDVVEKITGADKVNMVGFCVGGTLLAMAQAYLKAKGDDRINSLTFLTTLIDFKEPGEVGVYLSDEMYKALEANVDAKGLLDGRILGLSFSLLRENSLFWSYFVNNYLKGKKPPAFDILYWNSDSTNLPAAVFKQYVSNAYLDNKIKDSGCVTVDDLPIDISAIDTPAYFLATKSDHIVLWQASYKGAKLFTGPVRFVLAASGHLAGVINPVEGGKYPHWLNTELPESPEEWFDNAEKQDGSWWPDWNNWLAEKSGEKVTARKVGAKKKFPALEDAPGSYVKVRI